MNVIELGALGLVTVLLLTKGLSALNTLAEVTATEISRQRNPKGMAQSAQTAKEGGEVARSARADIESRLGHSVISAERASDYIRPIEDTSAQELPFDADKDE